MSATRLKDIIEDAPEVEIEPPRPLQRPLEPADPFPMEALGSVLSDAARAIVDQVQCPEAIAGQSILAVATLAVQGHADIELPQGSTAPLSSFFLTVAFSGDRKSTADRKALWPIRQREKTLRAQYDDAMPAYTVRQASWEASRRQILNNKKLSHEAKHAELEGLGPPPEPPLTPLLTCTEPTFEGLCLLLQGGHSSVGVFSAEGGQFLGGYGMSKDHRLKTAAALSGVWDGEPIKRVRRGDGVVLLPGRRVAMHLLVQPGVSELLLGSRELNDQGLVSRILTSAPVTTAGSRLWRDARPESDRAIARYGARILEILEHPLPLERDRPNELAPRTLRLGDQARQRLIAFMDHVELQLAPQGPLAPIRAFANKVPEHAARLGSVLALVEQLDADEVSSRHLEAGILLAEHYAAEARRLQDAGRNDPELDLAQRVLEWLAVEWSGRPLISVPDLYTYGPGPVRDKRTASRTIDILEDHGWLVREDQPARVNGTMRREVWRLASGAAR
jgi:Protein of unknown function (DUF3987)